MMGLRGNCGVHTDFGCAATIGQPLEGVLPPQAQPILAGPLEGTYGLCSAKTEQFAVGTPILHGLWP
jgi:hypothetical protein